MRGKPRGVCYYCVALLCCWAVIITMAGTGSGCLFFLSEFLLSTVAPTRADPLIPFRSSDDEARRICAGSGPDGDDTHTSPKEEGRGGTWRLEAAASPTTVRLGRKALTRPPLLIDGFRACGLPGDSQAPLFRVFQVNLAKKCTLQNSYPENRVDEITTVRPIPRGAAVVRLSRGTDSAPLCAYAAHSNSNFETWGSTSTRAGAKRLN